MDRKAESYAHELKRAGKILRKGYKHRFTERGAQIFRYFLKRLVRGQKQVGLVFLFGSKYLAIHQIQLQKVQNFRLFVLCLKLLQ